MCLDAILNVTRTKKTGVYERRKIETPILAEPLEEEPRFSRSRSIHKESTICAFQDSVGNEIWGEDTNVWLLAINILSNRLFSTLSVLKLPKS